MAWLASVWLLLGAAAPVGATSLGETAAEYAASQMGDPYVSGTPARPGLNYADPPSFDCSGLVWWVAERTLGTGFPYYVAADQATVGTRLSASPWSGELPIGALLFLADPREGAGITHVSIHLGNNIAADCYNSTDGCIAHDVSADNYYFKYWAFATYPWGDDPTYPSSGGTSVAPGSGSGAGSDGTVAGSVAAAAGGTGVIRAAVVSPVAKAKTAIDGVVSQANTAIGTSDPAALAAEQMAPVAGLVGYMKAVDEILPLHTVALLTAILVVLVVLAMVSLIKWVVDLLPG